MISCNYCTNPEPVAQLMKYKVSRALHAVTSYYTCMKLPYVLIPLPFTCVLDCGINFATTYMQWRIQKILVGGDLKPKPQKFGCLHQN